MTEKEKLLRTVDLFAATPSAILSELAQRLEEIIIQPDEAIFAQGDNGDALYIIAQGQVRIHSGGRTLTILEAPAVFGEIAVLAPEPRSADATAQAVVTRLYRLDRDALQQSMARDSAVADGLIQILGQRLRERTTVMVDDYHYLQQVARLTEAAVALENGIYLPESIDEVANREDALGQLATVFRRTIREVDAREQRLQQQVQELRIEVDQARQKEQVHKITGTDYFQQLRSKASGLRDQLEGKE